MVAATLPGQGLPVNSAGRLTAPQFPVPSPINHFNLSFSHWHHLDVNDGAWVEYKLDNGAWTYFEPSGGYPLQFPLMLAFLTGQTVLGSEYSVMEITAVGQLHYSI